MSMSKIDDMLGMIDRTGKKLYIDFNCFLEMSNTKYNISGEGNA